MKYSPLAARRQVHGPLAVGAGAGAGAPSWWLGPWASAPGVPAISQSQCLLAYQSKWAAGSIYARLDSPTYANSLINLNTPGINDAYAGTAPTWDISGWLFDTTSEFLFTGITPVDADYSYVIGVNDLSGTFTSMAPFGLANTLVSPVQAVGVAVRQSTNIIRFYNGTFNPRLDSASGGVTNGVYGIRANNAYIGTNQQAGAIPSGTQPYIEISIGKQRTPTGLQGNSVPHRNIGFAIYRPAITHEQMVQVLTALEIIRTV